MNFHSEFKIQKHSEYNILFFCIFYVGILLCYEEAMLIVNFHVVFLYLHVLFLPVHMLVMWSLLFGLVSTGCDVILSHFIYSTVYEIVASEFQKMHS